MQTKSVYASFLGFCLATQHRVAPQTCGHLVKNLSGDPGTFPGIPDTFGQTATAMEDVFMIGKKLK